MTNIAIDADRLYAGIGQVVVSFQFVEYGVAEVLASLLQMRHPSDVHRVTAAMSYAQKVNLMSRPCNTSAARMNADVSG